MRQIKVLWLSNRIQSERDGGTGTWLTAMAQELIASGKVELGNISHGPVAGITRQDYGQVAQWVVPTALTTRYQGQLPPARFIAELNQVVEAFAPDLVHVWGTELFWGLLTARKVIQRPALLEMQGVKGAIARVYSGGLSVAEQLACAGVKEVLRRNTILHGQAQFRQWGQVEREILAGHEHITVQSAWLEAQVRAANDHAAIYYREFPLQAPFYQAEPWHGNADPVIFCSTSYPSPFKGLHVAIRATAILKRRYPNLRLHIAGAHQKQGLRQDGFVAWLNREAARLGVTENLVWLGPQTVNQIVTELQNCAVTLLPTFVEGYCLALAESMYLGVPTVVSFTGGTAYLARDEESALFFPAGDVEMCAYQVDRLLKNRPLAENLARQAHQVGLQRSERAGILRRQVEIYQQVAAALPSKK